MSRLFGVGGIVAALVAVFLLINSLFTVDETEHVLVMQFGDYQRTISEPGLNAKIPFLQQTISYDKRVLNLDPAIQNFILADQKPLMVDYYVRYRIADPLTFLQRVRTDTNARGLLEKEVNSKLRDALGQKLLVDILSSERESIMAGVTERAREDSLDLGVEILDVRIGKADLPQQISQNVFKRMQTERQEAAAEFRAQGKKARLEIEAEADRRVQVMIAEAQKQAEILRGEGEASRTRALNTAYGEDPEFYEFFRSLEAYQKSLAGGTDPLVITTDHPFFSQFSNFDAPETASVQTQ